MLISRLRLSKKMNPKGYIFAPFLLFLSRFRTHFFLSILGFSLLIGSMLWYTGIAQEQGEKTSRSMAVFAGKMGYRLQDILIEGRHFTTQGDVLDALHMHQGQSLFTHDPTTIKDRIEQLPWVKEAVVRRHLPGVMRVILKEHYPIARWQYQHKFSLIAEDGTIIHAPLTPQFQNLPIVVGQDAPSQAPSILSLLSSYPEVGKRLSAVIRVNKRRWDLALHRGVVIKLPETGVEAALARLNFILEGKKINLDEVQSIDLRLPKQMIAKLPAHTVARLKLKGTEM